MEQAMRCGRCGDAIGVYEPLVLVKDGEVRITSVAAEAHIGEEPGERFHRACHGEQATLVQEPETPAAAGS